MKLSERDYNRLHGVKEDLLRVVERCAEICPIEFNVSEGVRTIERQRWLYKLGRTRTMKSKHLEGRAVDIYPLTDDRKAVDWQGFDLLAKNMKKAAEDCNVEIVWGGDWNTIVDKPHFELK